MTWLELKLQCTKAEAEALEELLWAEGAVSVTMTDAADEPLFEPGVGETPLWHELVLTGLFEATVDAQALQTSLALARAPQPLPPLHCSLLPDKDWVRSWLDDFKPMRFGQKLWVCPSWWLQQDHSSGNDTWTPSVEDAQHWSEQHRELLDAMQQPGQVVLQLDPGLAFGTGTHPTTAMCLQWLDACQALQGQRLVDFGCGSGILGIATLLLGAESVLGVDNDPQALTATADNCRKNHLAPARFPCCLPSAFQALVEGTDFLPVDGVMANILAGTLVDLAPLLSSLPRANGWLLLSGILKEQSDAVIAAYLPWFRDFRVVGQGDWVCISALKREDKHALPA